jgi:hypothetical protein
MSRMKFAAKILRPMAPRSILDVGCRDASLADEFSNVEYAGADLFPDKRGRIKYVGDIGKISFDRKFDAVVALDILEHLDRPSDVFDRLVNTSDRLVLVSLPNTYDLKSRAQFAFRGHLGGKYLFQDEPAEDRHRWLMNRREILGFFESKACKHGLSLEIFDLEYGGSRNATLTARAGRLLAAILPRSLSTATVFGLFSKPIS